jgi:hypothetical protein
MSFMSYIWRDNCVVKEVILWRQWQVGVAEARRVIIFLTIMLGSFGDMELKMAF